LENNFAQPPSWNFLEDGRGAAVVPLARAAKVNLHKDL